MKIYRSLKVTVWSTLLFAVLGCARSALAQDACKTCEPKISLTNWYPGDFNGNDLLTTNAGATSNVTYTPGEVQDAFTFAGNGNIQFGPNVANFGSSDFTVAFWMKSTTAGLQAVMENRTSCSATPFWSIRTNGVIEFELNNGERDFPVNAGGNVVDGNFHHIAVVRQGFHTGVFFDGTKVGNGATGDTEISVGDPGIFHVGTSVCTGLDGTANFTGQLDEIQIYNGIALQDREIRVLYESGHEGMCK